MASEDASFLWRLEQREMHIWGTVFPAEDEKGPETNVPSMRKKQERGQAGRVRHQVGGTGVERQRGPRPHKSTESTLGL